LHEEWDRNPPLPLLFAAWLGIKKEKTGSHDELLSRLSTVVE
jgi:hypothetical protein